MFQGSFKYSVDKKGRVSLPAKLRKYVSLEANDTFIILPGIAQCINVYPLDEWQKFLDTLKRLSQFDPQQAYFKRKMLDHAFEEKLDGQARLTIPQLLLQKARIDKEILIIGQLERIELWNPKLYEEYDSSFTESFADIAKSVMHGS